jgi:TRAP-type C4-dicarboxylate transport system substrate-binding protein
MRSSLHRPIAALGCFLALCSLPPVAAAGEPVRLKFSFFASDREFAFRGVVKPFADAVNLDANGTVEIELHPGGALGRNYAQQLQLVRSGVADFAWINPALTPEEFPDNGVLELPGLFLDAQEASRVHTRLAASGLLRGYADFHIVAAVATAPLTIHMRTPVASLADLKDRRLRSVNRTEGLVLKALGMEPHALAINQVADAINRGAINGSTSSLEVLADFGISRFATQHYMLGIGSVPLLIVMNRKAFDSLPEEARSVIRKYSGEWTASRYVATVESYDAEILEALRADPRRSVVEPPPDDLARARGVFASVIAQWAADSARNRELLHIVQAEILKLRSTR